MKEITKEEILRGIRQGVVKLTHEPGAESGTVCTIGEHWFYFGGQTAEDMDPEDFMKHIPVADIASEILSALEGIRDDLDGKDEYLYYGYFLEEHLKPEMSLKEKLYRCLEIAMRREDLSCHLTNIVTTLAEVMKNPDYHSPIMEGWTEYFIKKNEPKPTGTVKIYLTCPNCGDSNWIRREEDWECAACGEIAQPEDMCSEARDVNGK